MFDIYEIHGDLTQSTSACVRMRMCAMGDGYSGESCRSGSRARCCAASIATNAAATPKNLSTTRDAYNRRGYKSIRGSEDGVCGREAFPHLVRVASEIPLSLYIFETRCRPQAQPAYLETLATLATARRRARSAEFPPGAVAGGAGPGVRAPRAGRRGRPHRPPGRAPPAAAEIHIRV